MKIENRTFGFLFYALIFIGLTSCVSSQYVGYGDGIYDEPTQQIIIKKHRKAQHNPQENGFKKELKRLDELNGTDTETATNVDIYDNQDRNYDKNLQKWGEQGESVEVINIYTQPRSRYDYYNSWNDYPYYDNYYGYNTWRYRRNPYWGWRGGFSIGYNGFYDYYNPYYAYTYYNPYYYNAPFYQRYHHHHYNNHRNNRRYSRPRRTYSYSRESYNRRGYSVNRSSKNTTTYRKPRTYRRSSVRQHTSLPSHTRSSNTYRSRSSNRNSSYNSSSSRSLNTYRSRSSNNSSGHSSPYSRSRRSSRR